MKVLIVILNYNGCHLLKKHLPSIERTDYEGYEILVVDNGSEDGSITYLTEKHPDVKILQNERNLGFGRANNVAFEVNQGFDAYALLNNDMNVDPGWLKGMVDVMLSDEKIGTVGPKILYAKKDGDMYRINSAGGVVDKYDRGFDRYEGCLDSEAYCSIDDVDFVSGGAMLIRRSAVEEVKGFDERMFFYYEDVDICLRLRDKGWKSVYMGMVCVYHDHMGTAGAWSSFRVTRMSNMNRFRSIARRRGPLLGYTEFVRSTLEWIVYSLCGKIAGKSYRERILEGLFECRE